MKQINQCIFKGHPRSKYRIFLPDLRWDTTPKNFLKTDQAFVFIFQYKVPIWNLLVQRRIFHRSDSIQGTDYVANYFFLNVRVSKTKIENLK